jgi:hypothetical protein
LTAAVEIKDGREFTCSFWECVKCGHFGDGSFEYPDVVADDLTDNLVLFPVLQDFDIERGRAVLFVEICPKFIERCRGGSTESGGGREKHGE